MQDHTVAYAREQTREECVLGGHPALTDPPVGWAGRALTPPPSIPPLGGGGILEGILMRDVDMAIDVAQRHVREAEACVCKQREVASRPGAEEPSKKFLATLERSLTLHREYLRRVTGAQSAGSRER